MGRGRKPEERSIVAGKRFKVAKTFFGRTYENLIDDPRWQKIVGISDVKPLGDWIKNGMPLRRIGDVAAYFGVEGYVFADSKLKPTEFEKKIYESKFHLDNQDPDIPILRRRKQKDAYSIEQLLLDLKEFAAEWFHKGCPYGEIENSYKKFKLCLNDMKS